MKQRNTRTDRNESAPDRKAILAMLGKTIEDVHDRLEIEAAEDFEEEQLRIRWTRTLGYLVGQYRRLQSELDVDEMQTDLELLEVVTGLEEED